MVSHAAKLRFPPEAQNANVRFGLKPVIAQIKINGSFVRKFPFPSID